MNLLSSQSFLWPDGLRACAWERCRHLVPLLSIAGRREDYRQRDEWGDPDIRDSGWRSRIPFGLPVSYSGIILSICLIVFLLSQIVPGFVYNYLALNPDYVMQRPWTLLTHMFVHANFNHLLLNMLVLLFFGMELERRVGKTKFLEIYILSGIVAALAQMMVSGGYPGGSERSSLWSHGVSGHDCSRDSSAALLRCTYEHSGLGRAVCPDGFPDSLEPRTTSHIWPISRGFWSDWLSG